MDIEDVVTPQTRLEEVYAAVHSRARAHNHEALSTVCVPPPTHHHDDRQGTRRAYTSSVPLLDAAEQGLVPCGWLYPALDSSHHHRDSGYGVCTRALITEPIHFDRLFDPLDAMLTTEGGPAYVPRTWDAREEDLGMSLLCAARVPPTPRIPPLFYSPEFRYRWCFESFVAQDWPFFCHDLESAKNDTAGSVPRALAEAAEYTLDDIVWPPRSLGEPGPHFAYTVAIRDAYIWRGFYHPHSLNYRVLMWDNGTRTTVEFNPPVKHVSGAMNDVLDRTVVLNDVVELDARSQPLPPPLSFNTSTRTIQMDITSTNERDIPLPKQEKALQIVQKLAIFPTLYDIHFYHWTIETLDRIYWAIDLLIHDSEVVMFAESVFSRDMIAALVRYRLRHDPSVGETTAETEGDVDAAVASVLDRIIPRSSSLILARTLLSTFYSPIYYKMLPDIRRVRHVARALTAHFLSDHSLDRPTDPPLPSLAYSQRLDDTLVPTPRPIVVCVLRHGAGRNVRNYPELADALGPIVDRVFEYDPGAHNISAQVAMWQTANVFIGITGSHMAGILFARPGSVVIELTMTPPDPFLYHISVVRKHDHWLVPTYRVFFRELAHVDHPIPPISLQAITDIISSYRTRSSTPSRKHDKLI